MYVLGSSSWLPYKGIREREEESKSAQILILYAEEEGNPLCWKAQGRWQVYVNYPVQLVRTEESWENIELFGPCLKHTIPALC